MKEKFYVTTPIYYPSGKFHIGTAYTTTLADTIRNIKKKEDMIHIFLQVWTSMGKKWSKLQ